MRSNRLNGLIDSVIGLPALTSSKSTRERRRKNRRGRFGIQIQPGVQNDCSTANMISTKTAANINFAGFSATLLLLKGVCHRLSDVTWFCLCPGKGLLVGLLRPRTEAWLCKAADRLPQSKRSSRLQYTSRQHRPEVPSQEHFHCGRW